MTKKNSKFTPKQLPIKKLFDTHTRKMRDFLNLAEWEITTCIVDGLFLNSERSTTMVCTVQINYLRATIQAFDPACKCTEEELEETLMHELCHIITEPMYQSAIDNASPQENTHLQRLREQETERIARIAIKGYRALNK